MKQLHVCSRELIGIYNVDQIATKGEDVCIGTKDIIDCYESNTNGDNDCIGEVFLLKGGYKPNCIYYREIKWYKNIFEDKLK